MRNFTVSVGDKGWFVQADFVKIRDDGCLVFMAGNNIVAAFACGQWLNFVEAPKGEQ